MLPPLVIILDVQKDRPGSNNDTNLLKQTFLEIDSGAKVIVKFDPVANDIKKLITDLVNNENFENFSYVVLAFLSHGMENGIVGLASENERIILEQNILVPLCKIKALDGKMKILIVQTCRGSDDFLDIYAEGEVRPGFYTTYCLKLFACSEGTKAYRADSGSLFITALCKQLKSKYTTADIISIMKSTSAEVKNTTVYTPELKKIKQVPEYEENLGRKKFYFTTGVSAD